MVAPQAPVGDMPLKRQTDAMTTPGGCTKSLFGAGFFPFQSHGLLMATFMKSSPQEERAIGAVEALAERIRERLLVAVPHPARP